MRYVSLIFCLLTIALLGIGVREQVSVKVHGHARAERVVFKGMGTDPGTLWSGEVKSEPHAKLEDAWDDALDSAVWKVREYLVTRTPPIEWKPTPQFVRKRLVRKHTEEVKKFTSTGGIDMHQVNLKLTITAEDLRQIEQEDRKFHAEHRLWIVGRGLGGLVLLLGAVAGFIRLDELTKGYITWPLRITALTLGVAGAAAIWFVV